MNKNIDSICVLCKAGEKIYAPDKMTWRCSYCNLVGANAKPVAEIMSMDDYCKIVHYEKINVVKVSYEIESEHALWQQDGNSSHIKYLHHRMGLNPCVGAFLPLNIDLLREEDIYAKYGKVKDVLKYSQEGVIPSCISIMANGNGDNHNKIVLNPGYNIDCYFGSLGINNRDIMISMARQITEDPTYRNMILRVKYFCLKNFDTNDASVLKLKYAKSQISVYNIDQHNHIMLDIKPYKEPTSLKQLVTNFAVFNGYGLPQKYCNIKL